MPDEWKWKFHIKIRRINAFSLCFLFASFSITFLLNKKSGISCPRWIAHVMRREKKDAIQMKFRVNIEMSRDFMVHKLTADIHSFSSSSSSSSRFIVGSFVCWVCRWVASSPCTCSFRSFFTLSHQRRCRHFDHVENCAKNKVQNLLKWVYAKVYTSNR